MNFDIKLLWVVLAVSCIRVYGRKHRSIPEYNMEQHCGEEISMILSTMHQFELELGNQFTLADTCETVIESWYSYPNIMFYFDDLDLDCRDGYLQFFQGRSGSDRVEGLDYDVCGDDEPEGVFTVEKMDMRIRYVPRRKYYWDDVMTLRIAAYSKGECPLGSYKCDNGRCIHDDIKCNGENPCGDKSDCKHGLTSAAVAGIVIGCLGILFILLSICCWFVCCKKRKLKSAGTVQSPPTPSAAYTAPQSGYNHPSYGSASTNMHNPSYISPGTAPSAPGAPYSNFTVGQQPMYPPNVSIPAYIPGVDEFPPPYTELYGDGANSPQETSSVNTEPVPATYDNNKDKVTVKTDSGNTAHVYEPLGETSGDHAYDNVKTIS